MRATSVLAAEPLVGSKLQRSQPAGAVLCGARAARLVARAKSKGQQNADAAAAPPKKPSAPKRRGPKPTTSADFMQALDMSALEEFKKLAAEEQAQRALQPIDPENDPARYSFHRVLLNAASRGLPDLAEETVEQMATAGLAPGPRAYHALAFAYVRSKAPYEALDVAKRAAEEGLRLLPETYITLIYSLLNHADEPDIESAKEVMVTLEEQERQRVEEEEGAQQAAGKPTAGQTAGWLMLCKELFRKGLIADAMASVKRGYDEMGYVADPELSKYVIEQLARAGVKKAAWSELDKLVASGATPGPEHYNHLIRAEAASGAWRRARYMLIDAFTRPTWLPPNTDSLTSLLQGIVLSMDPATGLPTGTGVDTDDKGRADDLARAGQDPDADSVDPREAVKEQFTRLREELLVYGLRPNAGAYAAMCEGYIKLGALDEALGAFQSMMSLVGSTRLLSKKRLSALLAMLAYEDRPADLLNVLRAMVTSNQRLPRSAKRPREDAGGATIATLWLPLHMEYMRAHPDDGTGKGGAAAVMGGGAASMRKMLEQALQFEEYEDDVRLSVLGGCAVPDDGSGVWIKPPRMTLAELSAELRAANIQVPAGAKRAELVRLVKARREALPMSMVEVQGHLANARAAEEEALARKAGLSPEELAAKKGKKKGKLEVREYRLLQMEDGKVAKIQRVIQEVARRRTNFTIERGGNDPYSTLEALGDDEDGGSRRRKGRPGDEDDDELAEIIREGVDEGVGDIIRSEDTLFGEDGGDGEGTGLLEAGNDDMDVTIDVVEARVLNRTAGMSIAFEVLRCLELLGATPTGRDLEVLVEGAVAESNADVALELSDRLHLMLGMGYSREHVARLYGQLANTCLSVLRVQTADLVLERAEDRGLEVDPALYTMLTRALNGQPRTRELRASKVKELVNTADDAAAELLLDEDETEEGEEGETGSPERSLPPGAVIGEEDDEEDEDEDEGEEQYGAEVEALEQDQEKEEEAQGGPEHVEGVLDVGRELLLRVTGAGATTEGGAALEAPDMEALVQDVTEYLYPLDNPVSLALAQADAASAAQGQGEDEDEEEGEFDDDDDDEWSPQQLLELLQEPLEGEEEIAQQFQTLVASHPLTRLTLTASNAVEQQLQLEQQQQEAGAEEAPKKRGRPKTAQPQEAEDQQQELSDSTSLVLAGMTQQFGELAQAGGNPDATLMAFLSGGMDEDVEALEAELMREMGSEQDYEVRAEQYFRHQATWEESLRQRAALAAAMQQDSAGDDDTSLSLAVRAFNAALSEESQQRVEERVEARMENYARSVTVAEVADTACATIGEQLLVDLALGRTDTDAVAREVESVGWAALGLGTLQAGTFNSLSDLLSDKEIKDTRQRLLADVAAQQQQQKQLTASGSGSGGGKAGATQQVLERPPQQQQQQQQEVDIGGLAAEEQPVVSSRGRPRKGSAVSRTPAPAAPSPAADAGTGGDGDGGGSAAPKRGRPRKGTSVAAASVAPAVAETQQESEPAAPPPAASKGRGRPRGTTRPL